MSTFNLLRNAQDKIQGGFVKNRRVTIRAGTEENPTKLGFCLLGAVLAAMFEAMKGPNNDAAPLFEYVQSHFEIDADRTAVNVLFEALTLTPAWFKNRHDRPTFGTPGNPEFDKWRNRLLRSPHSNKVASLYAFNDSSGKAQVIQLLDDAIQISKAADCVNA